MRGNNVGVVARHSLLFSLLLLARSRSKFAQICVFCTESKLKSAVFFFLHSVRHEALKTLIDPRARGAGGKARKDPGYFHGG